MAEANTLVPKKAEEVSKPETTRGGLHYTPRVDIYDSPEELVLQCDIPGVKPDSVNLRFEKGELSLHGKVSPRPQPAQYLQAEYGIGDFYRSFTIGTEINAEKISAEYALGVLTIHLPKSERVKPRQIPIKPK